MIKQLKANGKSSYDDFNLYIKSRNPSVPTKRKNNKTVPGMHGSYDFSSLYGEVIYEDRTIEYVFDVTGWNVEDLDDNRRSVLDWLANINETKIYDEYMPNYYWQGSFSEATWSEDAEQGLLTVKFLVYPFAISINPVETKVASTSTEQTITINNNSSHRILPKIATDGSILVKKDNSSVNLSNGEWNIDNFYLDKGDNSITISGSANVTISYHEEVF